MLQSGSHSASELAPAFPAEKHSRLGASAHPHDVLRPAPEASRSVWPAHTLYILTRAVFVVKIIFPRVGHFPLRQPPWLTRVINSLEYPWREQVQIYCNSAPSGLHPSNFREPTKSMGYQGRREFKYTKWYLRRSWDNWVAVAACVN